MVETPSSPLHWGHDVSYNTQVYVNSWISKAKWKIATRHAEHKCRYLSVIRSVFNDFTDVVERNITSSNASPSLKASVIWIELINRLWIYTCSKLVMVCPKYPGDSSMYLHIKLSHLRLNLTDTSGPRQWDAKLVSVCDWKFWSSYRMST